MFAKVAQHWGLINAMSSRAGVDLGIAYLDGRIERSDLRSAVFTCTQCRQVAACEAFLAGPGDIEEIPGYCPNRGMILSLRAETC